MMSPEQALHWLSKQGGMTLYIHTDGRCTIRSALANGARGRGFARDAAAVTGPDIAGTIEQAKVWFGDPDAQGTGAGREAVGELCRVASA